MENLVKKDDKQQKFGSLSKFYCKNLGLRIVNKEYHACIVKTQKSEKNKEKIVAAYDLNTGREVLGDDLNGVSKINDMFLLREEHSPFMCWAEPNHQNKMIDAMVCRNSRLRLATLSSYVYNVEYALMNDANIRRDYFKEDKKVSLQTIMNVIKYVNRKEKTSTIDTENE